MTGTLWVGDGYVRENWPHFLNNGIRVVPGNDPDGPAGSVTLGQAGFVWAKITNKSQQSDANNALVTFYYQTFSVSLHKRNLDLIGTSSATVPAGQSYDVLCLSPFKPTSAAHGCLVVTVDHPLDPLPANWGTSPQRWQLSQVGQKNIRVLQAPAGTMSATPFEISASNSDTVSVLLNLETSNVPPNEIPLLLKNSGLDLLPQDSTMVRAGLSLEPSPANGWWNTRQLQVELPRGQSRYAYLISQTLPGPAAFALLNVRAQIGKQEIGGVSTVVARTPR